MLKIFIQGLKDGRYDVNISSAVEKIPDMFQEFFGDVTFNGTLSILGKRYTVTGTASCMAKMVCDLSLEEFQEEITAGFKASYLAMDHMHFATVNKADDIESEHVIRDDDKYIDITGEVREEMAVALPMKRIAPAYRGKSFEQIHPEFSPNSKKNNKALPEEDVRWAPLKSLKFNK